MSLYEIKEQKLDILMEQLYKNIQNKLKDGETRLALIKKNYVLKNPLVSFENFKNRMDSTQVKLHHFIKNYLDEKKHEQKLLLTTLKLVNPLNILEKGYSLVEKEGQIIQSSDAINIEDLIHIKLRKGELIAVVKEKKEWKI